MRFQLIAKIKDPELLRKSIHELGTLFYVTEKDAIFRVVYFSGSRIVEYIGTLDEDFAKRVRAEGHKVDSIEVDEIQGYVRIVQA